MQEERARVLLREERRRLERLLVSVATDHDRVAPADEVSEDLVDGADRRTSEETDEDGATVEGEDRAGRDRDQLDAASPRTTPAASGPFPSVAAIAGRQGR